MLMALSMTAPDDDAKGAADDDAVSLESPRRKCQLVALTRQESFVSFARPVRMSKMLELITGRRSNQILLVKCI